MNYLAHALLSPADPLVLMGNLWGDLIKPRDYASLDISVREGVQFHKAIDAFTDQHPAVDTISMLLRPYQGKYTPVVADVLMDFILSAYWDRYHETSLEVFCESRYSQVRAHLEFIPDHLHPRINRMLGHQWLESCKDRIRMEQTLVMLSRRAAFANKIPEAMTPYDLYKDQIDNLFHTFFEDLRREVSLRNEG